MCTKPESRHFETSWDLSDERNSKDGSEFGESTNQDKSQQIIK